MRAHSAPVAIRARRHDVASSLEIVGRTNMCVVKRSVECAAGSRSRIRAVCGTFRCYRLRYSNNFFHHTSTRYTQRELPKYNNSL